MSVTFRFPFASRRSPLERRDFVSLRFSPSARAVPRVSDRSYAEFRRSTVGLYSPVRASAPMSTSVEWPWDHAKIGPTGGGLGAVVGGLWVCVAGAAGRGCSPTY